MAKSNGQGQSTGTVPNYRANAGNLAPQGLLANGQPAPTTSTDMTAPPSLLSPNGPSAAPSPSAGIGQTLLDIETQRNAASGQPAPIVPPDMNLGQQLSSLGQPGFADLGAPTSAPIAPDPTPLTSGGQGAGVGKTLFQIEAERNAAMGLPAPQMPQDRNLGQQLAATGQSFGFGAPPPQGNVSASPQFAPPAAPITADPTPLTSGYGDPAPQPPVYTDQAIARTGPPIPIMKGPAQPAALTTPQVPTESPSPLDQAGTANQQALADALMRLRAAQGSQTGAPPTSLFRRASAPMGAYQ